MRPHNEPIALPKTTTGKIKTKGLKFKVKPVDKGPRFAIALQSVQSPKKAKEALLHTFEINEALAGDPSLINSDAAGKGWFFKLKIADKGELTGLMDEAAYKAHTA